jgi:hypothetical protein
MNVGLLGLDGVANNPVIHRTPPVRMSRYTGGVRYSIAHPFAKPFVVRPILTCRIAQGTFVIGDEVQWQPTDGNSQIGFSLLIRPYELIIVFTGTVGVFVEQSSHTTIATTPANWDVAFVVLG